MLLGVAPAAAILVGLPLALSSTAVVLPVLAEQKRLNAPAGRASFACCCSRTSPSRGSVRHRGARPQGRRRAERPRPRARTGGGGAGRLVVAGRLALRRCSTRRPHPRSTNCSWPPASSSSRRPPWWRRQRAVDDDRRLRGRAAARRDRVPPRHRGDHRSFKACGARRVLRLGRHEPRSGRTGAGRRWRCSGWRTASSREGRDHRGGGGGAPPAAAVAIESALLLGRAASLPSCSSAAPSRAGWSPRECRAGGADRHHRHDGADPGLAALARRLSARADRRNLGRARAEPPPPDRQPGRVIIAGYGRFGRLVGEMLARHKVPFLPSTSTPPGSPSTSPRQAGLFGDSANTRCCAAAGIATAAALVVTLDQPSAVEAAVLTAKAERPT